MVAILDTGRRWWTQFWKGTTQGSFQQTLVEIGSVVSEEEIFFNFIPLFLFLAWWPSWLEVGITGQNFGRGPSIQRLFHQSLVAIGPVVSEEKIFMWISHRVLCLIKIGCGGHLGQRSEMQEKFWKGTTQGSFQQSLVEIGSVVSEKIFFLISSPLISILSLAAILVGSRDHRTQFWKGAIQGQFHQSLVAISPMFSEEKIFMWISHRVLC